MANQPWSHIEAALGTASPERCRRVAIAAASRALEQWPDRPRDLDVALGAARTVSITDELRAGVERTVDELDRVYFELHDDEKPGGQTPGWEEAFGHARAAAAVFSALDADPREAAVRATYEAEFALDEDLLPLVQETA